MLSYAGGLIKVFGKTSFSAKFMLLISATDPKPISVKFISFGSSKNTKMDFYYDCSYPVAESDLEISNYQPLPKNIFQKTMYTEQEFLGKCNRYERFQHEYTEFILIGPRSKPNGFYFAFPIYVRSDKDANILLTATDRPDFNRDEVYEIGMSSHFSTYHLPPQPNGMRHRIVTCPLTKYLNHAMCCKSLEVGRIHILPYD